MPPQGRQLAEHLFEALNRRDLDAYVQNLDDNYVWESDTLPGPARGKQEVKRVLEMYFRAFPDLRFEIEQILMAGDTLVTCWRTTGTHQGEFLGVPATKRTVGARGCTISEIRNGKLLRGVSYWDRARVLEQIGALHTREPKKTGGAA